MWFPKQLNKQKAKYIAIADALERDIRNRIAFPGEKLPSQRELAYALSVNLTTVSRAYGEAERRGLIKGTVGRGTFISADATKILECPSPTLFKAGEIEMGMVLSLYHLEPELEEGIAKLSSKQSLSEFKSYSEPAGLPHHLAIGREWVKNFGFEPSLDRLVVAAGAQHALTCTLLSCFSPGDRIAVDCITYSGFKNLAAMMNIRLTPIPMDAEGMMPDCLKTLCNSKTIKGIYLMPGFHNPTGITLSIKRRKELLSVIEEFQLLLIEDDPYYFLAAAPLPAMSSYIPENSVFICSFSKILYAGLRSAFIVSSKKIRSRIASAILNTIWMSPALNTAIVCDAIVNGTVERVIQRKIEEAKRRNDIAWSILPFSSNAVRTNGFYIWYQLPEPWSGYEFEAHAKKEWVSISCAEQFTVGSPDIAPAARICLTPVSKHELSEGLSRLADILDTGYWSLKENKL